MTSVQNQLVHCPHCSMLLRVSTKIPVINCPYAKRRRPAKATTGGRPCRAESAPQEGEAAETTARSLGEYLKLYWRMSRGGWIFPMYVATVAAIALSFFKPLIGAGAIIGVAGAVALLFVFSSLTFLMGRSVAYLILRQRVVSEESTSRWAWLAFNSIVTLLFPFVPLAAVEAWGPSEGQLARLVPIVKRAQEQVVQDVDRFGFLRRLSRAIRGISDEEPAIEVADRAGKPETSTAWYDGDARWTRIGKGSTERRNQTSDGG